MVNTMRRSMLNLLQPIQWGSPAFETGEQDSAQEAFREPRIDTGFFQSPQGTRKYLAYSPRAKPARPPALLLMLHGGAQDAVDFARGTRIHLHSAAKNFVVVYPSQSSLENPNACWNWFRPTDQQRDKGEPALLATLARQMADRFNCDRDRIYVAGLSAGGAMAVTLGQVYPEIFRAVGSHSGLPYGCAQDAQSAFSVMRNGPGDLNRDKMQMTPTIVFHGDQDGMVNVRNAQQVIDDARGRKLSDKAGSGFAGWSESSAKGNVASGREFTTTITRDAAGSLITENWLVHGGGHAWFGGNADGSYTDANGPDASGEMLRFFGDVTKNAVVA